MDILYVPYREDTQYKLALMWVDILNTDLLQYEIYTSRDKYIANTSCNIDYLWYTTSR